MKPILPQKRFVKLTSTTAFNIYDSMHRASELPAGTYSYEARQINQQLFVDDGVIIEHEQAKAFTSQEITNIFSKLDSLNTNFETVETTKQTETALTQHCAKTARLVISDILRCFDGNTNYPELIPSEDKSAVLFELDQLTGQDIIIDGDFSEYTDINWGYWGETDTTGLESSIVNEGGKPRLISPNGDGVYIYQAITGNEGKVLKQVIDITVNDGGICLFEGQTGLKLLNTTGEHIVYMYVTQTRDFIYISRESSQPCDVIINSIKVYPVETGQFLGSAIKGIADIIDMFGSTQTTYINEIKDAIENTREINSAVLPSNTAVNLTSPTGKIYLKSNTKELLLNVDEIYLIYGTDAENILRIYFKTTNDEYSKIRIDENITTEDGVYTTNIYNSDNEHVGTETLEKITFIRE